MWRASDSGASVVKLDDFRREMGWSYSALGRRLGVDPPRNARRYCLPRSHKDHRFPHAYVDKIFALSGGRVTANDLHEQPPVSAKKRAAA